MPSPGPARRGVLGLKSRHYYILLSLARADRHGLAIAREVEQLSEGRVKLWPATLYGSLEDLRDRGWIEERPDPSEEGGKRRFYRITRAGRAVLAAETERLAALVRIARSRVKAQAGESG